MSGCNETTAFIAGLVIGLCVAAAFALLLHPWAGAAIFAVALVLAMARAVVYLERWDRD